MRGKMTPLCRRHFEINFNEWKSLYFDLTFFRICSTSTHELRYHVSRAVVTQVGQLWQIWPNLANLTGKLQTTFFQWKYLNSDWYYIEVCFKGIIYNKSELHCFVWNVIPVVIRTKRSKCSILFFSPMTFVSCKPFHRKRLLNDRLFCNHHAHPLRQAWAYR